MTLWAYKETSSMFFNLENDGLKFTNKNFDGQALDMSSFSYQILVGYIDGDYVFLDVNNSYMFFIPKKHISKYLNSFIKTKFNLFDIDFKEYKEKILKINEKNINYFKITNE